MRAGMSSSEIDPSGVVAGSVVEARCVAALEGLALDGGVVLAIAGRRELSAPRLETARGASEVDD